MCRRSVSLSVRADFKVSSAFGREEAMRWLERVAQGQLAVNLSAIDRDQDGQGRPSLSDGQFSRGITRIFEDGTAERPTHSTETPCQAVGADKPSCASTHSRHRDVALHRREFCETRLSWQGLPQVAAAQDHRCQGQRPLILSH